MITKIKIKNFRSHLDTELEFSRGTNVLIGILGSGKSSVMNGICFGLFGTFPDLQTKKIKLDDVIMNKPDIKDTSEVEVSFNMEGRNFSVMRVIERGKGTTYSEIREGDKLIDAPQTQRVTETVEKILKVNYELFSKAIYSEQNALDYFLTLPRGERMRRIDNLLTIDKFEKARSTTVSLRNKFLERKIAKQNLIDQTKLAEFKETIDDIEYSLKGLKKSKKKVSNDLEVFKQKELELKDNLEKLEELNKNLISYQQKEKSLESAIEENEKNIENIQKILKGKDPKKIKKSLVDFSKKLELLENNLTKKRNEYEKISNMISESKTRIEFLEKEKIEKLEEEILRKDKLKEKINDIEKKYKGKPTEVLKRKREELEKIEIELSSVETKLLEIQGTLDQVHKLKDKCPVCLSKLTDPKKKKLIKQQKDAMEKIKKKLEEIQKNRQIKKDNVLALDKIIDEYTKWVNEVSDLDDLQKQLKNSRKNHSELMESVKDKEKEFTKLKDGISKLQSSINDKKNEKKDLEFISSRLSEFNDIKIRLSEFQIKEKEVKERIAKIKKEIGEKDVVEIRKQFMKLVSKRSELQERVKSLTKLITEKETRKKDQEEKLNLIEAQKKEILKLEKLIKELKIFEKALEKTQVQLRKEFIDTVNYTMNDIWPNIYPYDDFTRITLNIEGGDYVLQLGDRMGRMGNVDGIASGGERSIASLTLRIALSLVLAPQLKWLVLDEPTHNLDSKAIEDLAQTLKTRVGDFVDQIFLITHEEKLEEAVTGNLYRLERDKEKDGVTKTIKVN
jgi:exonuclease SbcC